MSAARPLVAVTLGDPSGVGPELAVRVLADRAVHSRIRVVVLGDAEVARENIRRAGLALGVREVADLGELRDDPAVLDVLVPANSPLGPIAWGQLNDGSGRSALAALELAGELAAAGAIDAVLSAPVNKQALRLAGMQETDELALFAERTGSQPPLLVGVLDDLLTACVTLHVPLRHVPTLVTRVRVRETIASLANVLESAGGCSRIVVAGLNPHAGDGGLLGREELDEIAPAIEDARADGLDVLGPVAPDAAFPQARALAAAGVVCMYHDQANIARKLAGFRGATVFAGLPVPVATTAHGTAFDLAGKGQADPASMELALEQLIRLATPRGNGHA